MSPSVAGLLAAKDRAELLRDRRLIVAIVLVVLLAAAAIVATYVRVSDYERDRSAAAAMDRESWLGQGARDPHSAAHFAQWAFRPVDAPALLDPGTLAHTGSAIWMEAHARNPPVYRPYEDRPGALQVGEFSAAWVLQVLAPLLLLVLAAGAVARERERGTLKLMLATGLRAGELVRAKAISMIGLTAVIALPLLALAALAVWLAPQSVTADGHVRALLWCGAHVAFLMTVALIGVAVSSAFPSTAAALIAVIGIWVVAIPVAPRAAAALAETLHPVPAGDRFWSIIQADIRHGFDGSGTAEERTAALEKRLLERYGVADTEDLPISFRGASLDHNERFGNLAFERRFAELYDTYEGQRRVMRLFSLVTPVISVHNLSAALAGTDGAHARDFADQAESERQRVVNALNRDLTLKGAGNPDYRADERLWRQFGLFEPVPMPLASAARAIWPDLLVLLAWLLLAGALIGRAGHAVSREPLR